LLATLALDIQKCSDVAANRFLGSRLTMRKARSSLSCPGKIWRLQRRHAFTLLALFKMLPSRRCILDCRIGKTLEAFASFDLCLSLFLPSLCKDTRRQILTAESRRDTLGDPWQLAATRFRLALETSASNATILSTIKSRDE